MVVYFVDTLEISLSWKRSDCSFHDSYVPARGISRPHRHFLFERVVSSVWHSWLPPAAPPWSAPWRSSRTRWPRVTASTRSSRASPRRSAKGWRTPSQPVSSTPDKQSSKATWVHLGWTQTIVLPDLQLYHSETLELMLQRWSKLERDFRMKNGRYDISKIPDIYDCVKYDVIHNATLGLEDTLELFRLSRALADIVIPQVWQRRSCSQRSLNATQHFLSGSLQDRDTDGFFKPGLFSKSWKHQFVYTVRLKWNI